MRARTTTHFAKYAAISAVLLIALTGCSASGEPAPAETTTVAQPTETAAAPECSGLTGQEALEKWGSEVASDRPWDLAAEYSEVTGYDECAELSWIVLRPESCCTAFEVTPVLFFHRGEFVAEATVTDRAIDRTTEPKRISDAEVALTFTAQGGSTQPVLTTTTYTWDEATSTVVATEPEPAASDGTANGRWCPTPESNDQNGCVTIALPTASYDNGVTTQLTEQGDLYGDGGISFRTPGAPFGTFYAAGLPIALPSYYVGADRPDEDRIWNGQTGVMLVRA